MKICMAAVRAAGMILDLIRVFVCIVKLRICTKKTHLTLTMENQWYGKTGSLGNEEEQLELDI
jgi:hypothetical protein